MSLRDRLRFETRQQHTALESRLDLLRHDFQLPELTQLLERHYGYYRPCERQIADLPAAQRDFLEPRRKLPLLINDLQMLGHTSVSLATLPECELAPLDSVAAALGRWYVLEGSTLGGQLLARHFEQRFQLSDGLSFFRSYGADVGPMWQSCCQWLDENSSPETDDAAIHSANETFATLSGWLT
jgi:heme oxygenase (biliverdin-IX-beta and delta-forming)